MVEHVCNQGFCNQNIQHAILISACTFLQASAYKKL